MARSENFVKAIQAINALTQEELTALVPYWKQASKAKRAANAMTQVVEKGFRNGDILSWVSTKGRTRGERYYFKFVRMNRAGTAAQGPTCTRDGVVLERGFGGGTCTVAPQFIDMVNGQAK